MVVQDVKDGRMMVSEVSHVDPDDDWLIRSMKDCPSWLLRWR